MAWPPPTRGRQEVLTGDRPASKPPSGTCLALLLPFVSLTKLPDTQLTTQEGEEDCREGAAELWGLAEGTEAGGQEGGRAGGWVGRKAGRQAYTRAAIKDAN